jgi:protein involved in polysaccharide export with SLBB domain
MQGFVDSFSIQQRRIQQRVVATGAELGRVARHLDPGVGLGARSIVPGGCTRALFALALLAALGCSTTLTPPPSAPTPSTYRVGAPDQLLVSILPDPVIERAVTVRPDGMISIDLAGDIRAAGHTVDEIAAEVERRVAVYKRGASVTVSVVAAQSTAVTVLGEVRGNQSFPLVKETRVAEAMGIVGGTTIFGNIDEVRVIRSRAGETVVYDVDLEAISEGDLRTNIVLAAGDLVYVPPTLWARFGYAMQALFFPLQPILGFGVSLAGAAAAP